ncbi:hypothetical protein T492DRAFT_344634 [Pavlovales sp. CCMP2436]|nr:hypothetical protein T492DRAFT_344634 [Pavlovales sp. CCMP2436]
MAVDAERTCAHCHRAIDPGAEHLALACGGGELTEAHAMHCSCAWAALSGAGEIQCGVPGCAARHGPSACTLHASSGRRSAALLATKVAGGPSAPGVRRRGRRLHLRRRLGAGRAGTRDHALRWRGRAPRARLQWRHPAGAQQPQAAGRAGLVRAPLLPSARRRGEHPRRAPGLLALRPARACVARGVRDVALRVRPGHRRGGAARRGRARAGLAAVVGARADLPRVAAAAQDRGPGGQAHERRRLPDARAQRAQDERQCQGPLLRAPAVQRAAQAVADAGAHDGRGGVHDGHLPHPGRGAGLHLGRALRQLRPAHDDGLRPVGRADAGGRLAEGEIGARRRPHARGRAAGRRHAQGLRRDLPTPKAAVAALTPNDDDIVHVGKCVFTFLEDALALVAGGTLPELAAPGVKGTKKGYNEGDPKYQVELESTLALRAGYEEASDDRHLPPGERLMAPEDESGDPDEEYRDGPPDGLGGGPSAAAPAPAPAIAPAPASAPAADDGAPLLPQTTVPEQKFKTIQI